MNSRFVSRVRMASVACVLIALIISGRLYFLQVVEGKAYEARADAQFIAPSNPLTDRDSIYFTDKDGRQIVAASLKDGFSLAVNPTKVVDAELLYQTLQPFIPQITHDDFIAKATKKNTQYQIIANRLDTALGLELQQKNLPGVVLAQDRWRVYSGGSLAAQELGFVAYNGDLQEGRYGLERYYEQTLSKVQQSLYGNFFVQLFGAAHNLSDTGSQTGDIVTTIDPAVQAQLEGTLNLYNATWHAVRAGGIIMDPKTGEIVAMAVAPNFDLNAFNEQEDPHIFANPMVEDVYEMGSIVKPLTMAAGLDSGAIMPTTTYDDLGCITVDKKPICNYDQKARGVIPMQEILSQSLNLGASFIATRMGSSTMRKYFLDGYKLGEESGIDLPGEIHGLTDNLKKPQQVQYDTASFGQGIAITPIETVRALAVLANGGQLVTPHLVKEINYDDGSTRMLGWGEPVQVLKPETALQVSRMLTLVVDKSLANGTIKLEHYSVAAKTGTAQIANPAGGGYYTDRFVHSFFGYFPSYDARFIVFLFAYEPQGAPFASQTWAGPFHDLTQFLINYYNIPPDR